jgi:hypothetical protein
VLDDVIGRRVDLRGMRSGTATPVRARSLGRYPIEFVNRLEQERRRRKVSNPCGFAPVTIGLHFIGRHRHGRLFKLIDHPSASFKPTHHQSAGSGRATATIRLLRADPRRRQLD